MSQSRPLAVYAGSFDPPTNGHMYMVREGAALFSGLVVAVGVNPRKPGTFAPEQRVRLLRECTAGITGVEVDSFANSYLIDYARSRGARFILRGIRSVADFDYEQKMRHVNADRDPGITTVFLMPPREYAEISSSFVKELVGFSGWQEVVRRYLPEPVLAAFLERFA